MFDIFTFSIYIFLLAILVHLTSYSNKYLQNHIVFQTTSKLDLKHLIAILIISIIVGFRYQVGVDWEGYVRIFQDISSNSRLNSFTENLELGYFYINYSIGYLGLSYQWMFFVVAGFTWYFYFKSVPKYILPFFIFFLFTDEYFFWGMNGVRQFAAISIWVFSVKFIINKDLKLFILSILGASLFHQSAILLLPFYFVPYQKLYNRSYWLIIYFLSIIAVFFLDLSAIYQNLDSLILGLSDNIDTVQRYSNYAENGLSSNELSLGLGFFFKLLINIVIIFLSKDLINKNYQLKPYFFLYFIGTILFNIFYEFQIIGRITNYFLIFRSLVLAFIIYHLILSKKYRIVAILIMVLYFLLFLSAMYASSNMCCPYSMKF